MINYATDNWPLQYLPLCTETKLNHLMFSNDRLIFCKVYYNGVPLTLKNAIQQATRFVEGTMPFRYLEVAIQAGRQTNKECNVLVERMVNRIRSIGAKKLSYAGRLVLINSVQNTLYSNWGGMFLIPKCVIRRIGAIGWNYLWDRSSDYHRVPLIAWDMVTLPKKAWGDWVLRKQKYGT
ncbi:uncharacterized protein LOC141631508 [Silene latifolia]|uniref:uncharacterized protein LOC141631508 n=1 Tax=Silene latifolia TaxID=37657 RepID=UPI003D76E922